MLNKFLFSCLCYTYIINLIVDQFNFCCIGKNLCALISLQKTIKRKLNEHWDNFTISCLGVVILGQGYCEGESKQGQARNLVHCSYVVPALNLAVFREFNPTMFRSSAEWTKACLGKGDQILSWCELSWLHWHQLSYWLQYTVF